MSDTHNPVKYFYFVDVGRESSYGIWPLKKWISESEVTLTGRWRLHNSNTITFEIEYNALEYVEYDHKFFWFTIKRTKIVNTKTKSWLSEDKVKWEQEFNCGKY